MNEGNDQDAGKGRLSLRPAGRLELGRTVDAGSVRQSFSHGRSKVVQVEVRKKRAPAAPPAPGSAPAPAARPPASGRSGSGPARALTATEQAARQRALVEQQRDAARREAERREQEKISILSAAEEARRREEEARKA
ncbi:MAG: IF-2-associated domain-containing protein, partial [Acetobacteraceae bacterium]|nr:IF-2-associated domain-containing protein [Acetobacteraceae bacterium]